MIFQVRHTGSPQVVQGLSLEQVADGLRDDAWEPTDEVRGSGEANWTPIENHPLFADLAMELEAPEPRHRDDATHLDFNALIDVCLVLLIFFILTTTYAVTVQKVVPLPGVKYDEKTKAKVIRMEDVKKRMIRLEAFLDSNGKPVLRVENQPVLAFSANGQSIDKDKLHDALRPYTRGDDRRTELLLDARGISWGTVIAIQDAARRAGIRDIHHLLDNTRKAGKS